MGRKGGRQPRRKTNGRHVGEDAGTGTRTRRISTAPLGVIETDPHLAAAFAAVDAANRQGGADARRRARRPAPGERDPLVYDPDWDEDARLGDWRAVVEQTRTLPPTLAAAIAAEAWDAIAPLQHTPWLGRLLAAALLRQRGKSRWHLPCLHAGLKAIPRERRRAPPRDAAAQLVVQLEAITAAAAAGLNGPRPLADPAHPARPQTRRPPRHLKTAGAARLCADPPDRLGRHDRRRARDHGPRRPKPGRRAGAARGDRTGTLSGLGDSLKNFSLLSDIRFACGPKKSYNFRT